MSWLFRYTLAGSIDSQVILYLAIFLQPVSLSSLGLLAQSGDKGECYYHVKPGSLGFSFSHFRQENPPSLHFWTARVSQAALLGYPEGII